MPNYFLNIAFAFTFLTAATVPSIAYSFDGPMETKNQFPLFTHLNAVSFEGATLENSYSLNFSYSTIYFVKTPTDWETSLDMELAGIDLRARRIFDDSVELGIEVPVLSFNAGFMDGVINNFHDDFGFPSYGRKNRPENEFLYEVKRNGVTIVKGKSGHAELSDIRLSAKKALMSSDPALSLKLAVELPTGDAKKGYGSGNIGADISLLLDRKFGDRYMTYFSLGAAFPGDLDAYEKVETRNFAFGGAALEMSAWDNLNLLAQITFQGSPYPKTGIKAMDAIAMLLTFGGRFTTGSGGSYDFSFAEDPNGGGIPDFTIGMSYKQKF